MEGSPIAWNHIDPHWRQALDLAWQALRSGSVGVGAVMTDADGTVVATGRNRWNETAAGDDLLANSRVAHAEINVLAKVPIDRLLDDCTLWTTLEPCLQCAAAALQSRVGTVRYLATDPLWHGVTGVVALNPFVAARWPRRIGPDDGTTGRFAAVLALYRPRIDKPDGVSVAALQERMPDLALLVERILDAGIVDAAVQRGTGIDELFAEMEPFLRR